MADCDQGRAAGGRGRWRRCLVWFSAMVGVFCCVCLIFWYGLPLIVDLPDAATPQPLVLQDRNGLPMAFLPDRNGDCYSTVEMGSLPQALIDATLVAEDRRFGQHGGVDVLASLRAAASRLGMGGRLSGASTIHQQLAKLLCGNGAPEKRTWAAKVREVLLARRMAMSWGDDLVLERYLARLPYGNQCFGPEAAAFFYFGKDVRDLSLAQLALLAAVPNAPSRLNPLKYPGRALQRRNWILSRLESEKGYAAEHIARALEEPLDCGAHIRRPWGEIVAPHIVSRVRRSHDSGVLKSSLDVRLQREVEQIAREEVARLRDHRVTQAAVVVLDNRTGEPLAWLGSVDRGGSVGGLLDGVFSVSRSSGSTLKPFVYALALEKSRHPCEMIPDVPTYYRQPDGVDAPENYDRRYRGPVSMRDALGNSLNIPAMRALSALGKDFEGVESLMKLLRSLGMTTLHRTAGEYGLGIAIGTSDVTLYELSRAYAVLARLGEPLPVPPLQPGEFPCVHAEVPAPGSRVLSAETCYMLADILSDAQARRQTFGLRTPLRLPFRCAVKTGTSSNYRDNWCVGFTKEVTVGVWVGNYDGTTMRNLGGVDGAGPIFHRVMQAVYEGGSSVFESPGFPEAPASLVRVEVDARTGHALRPGDDRQFARDEWCVRGHTPRVAADGDFDATGRARLDHRYTDWFRNPASIGIEGFVPDGDARLNEEPRILIPPARAHFMLDPDMPNQGRFVQLKSNLDDARWECETLPILERGGRPVVELRPGTHVIRLIHPSTGKRVEHTIQVDTQEM